MSRTKSSAINFVAGSLTTPTNRADTDLGQINNFRPVEPTIVVNPADPSNIAVSSQRGVRLSTNAGGNFTGVSNFTNPPDTDTFNGDTDLIFDSQGRLFWSNLAGTGTMGVSVNEINPETGANISTTNVRNNGDDKEFITADQTLGSRFQDNLYMVWTGNLGISTAEVYFSRSTDQGVNWDNPMQLSDNAGGEGFPWPSDVGVAPNGDVYAAYHAGGSSGTQGDVWVLRSTDGGKSFPQKNQPFLPGQADITFNVQTGSGTIPNTQFWMQGAAQPWVLPDPARPGNVYIITSDDPDNVHGTAADDVDIVIARSTNNGQNWTRTTLPVNPVGGSHQFFPTAAIDEFGNIAVAWYDNRNGQTNTNGNWLLDVFATYSTDGGVTWATPFQVNDNDNPFDPDIGAVNRFNGPPATTRIGEYFGIDIFGGTAYVAWTDSNAATATQTVTYDAFAIAGSLTVDGDNDGETDDKIIVQNITDNTDFIEVLVNGETVYAGLEEALSSVTVKGLGGDDQLEGGENNDILNGGDDNDQLLGEEGNDILNGGDDDDTLDGGEGNDTLDGGDGDDQLEGGAGNDLLDGGEDSDQVSGGDGNDILNGGDDDDTLDGGEGNDTLNGEDGDDLMKGGAGDDLLDGGEDRDEMFGEDGNDTLKGGDNNDILDGGDGQDILNGEDGDDLMKGGAGDDLLDGGEDRDEMFGEDGDDTLNGGKNNDLLDGGDGNDILNGEDDDDVMEGGAGDDVLNGGADRDELSGGAGDDTLDGGEGEDQLLGGEGADIFRLSLDEDTDIILDYHDGLDKFELVSQSINVQDLSFLQDGTQALITITETEEVLAALIGVSASVLDAGDFV